MKESLAARQAALLRQNAELDQKVEAIEQRRQQQLQSAKSTSGSSSNLTKRHEISLAEPSSAVFSDDDDGGLEGGVSDSMSSPERGVSLKMDFTGSIDSTPDDSEKINGTEDTKPFTATRQKSQLRKDKSAENVAAGLASESTRKPARRHKAGSPAMGQEETKQSESSRDVKQTMDEDDGLGLDATVRYQKARLRVLQDELDVAHSHLKEMQGTQQQLRTTNEELASDNTTLKKKHLQTQQLLEKQQELSAAQESKQKILESQLSAAQAKMDELQKAEKKASQQFRSKDVRLNRALEELEKAKAQLQDERQAQGDQLVSKAEHDHVLKDNKRLEKQKNELLVAFKKQMKLIDLLKRQRIHMEAAKMLSFTEEEFSKTLELG